jgi:hypothetical protein
MLWETRKSSSEGKEAASFEYTLYFAKITRFKERLRQLEEQVRSLKEEDELLHGKLTI